MAFTARQMRDHEAAAFRRGVEAGTLMDLAGAGLAGKLLNHFPRPGTAVAYLGKGNNAGDALVVLDHLRRAGWSIACRASHPETDWTALSRERLRRLALPPQLSPFAPSPPDPRPLLLLDGLLGIGARGALRGPLATLAAEMNRLRVDFGAVTAAIDLPSGLDTDSGLPAENAVVADLTLTLGVPKIGLFADTAANHTGRLFLVPLDDLPLPTDVSPLLITPDILPGLLAPRPHDFHKGDAGRVAVLAGSPGMEGAALLAASGALRGGAGLVTLFIHENARLPAAPAELMIRRSRDPLADLAKFRHDALVAGPGLGDSLDPAAFFNFLSSCEKPAVLDADALNLLAKYRRLDLLRPSYLITPHPGEFARLAPDLTNLPRLQAATEFVRRHPCALLLKGSRTVLAAPGQAPRLNPTGHPGMASGGQGDLLSGVSAALLALGLAPIDAGSLAAWTCGHASEIALTHSHHSEQSLLPIDTLHHLGPAFTHWRQRTR